MPLIAVDADPFWNKRSKHNIIYQHLAVNNEIYYVHTVAKNCESSNKVDICLRSDFIVCWTWEEWGSRQTKCSNLCITLASVQSRPENKPLTWIVIDWIV